MSDSDYHRLRWLRTFPPRGWTIALLVAAALGGAALLAFALSSSPPTPAAQSRRGSQPPGGAGNGSVVTPLGVRDWGEVTYGDDGYVAHRCSGPSSALHYEVFSPAGPGPHPVVFGMAGSGFAGTADCDPRTGTESYHSLDAVMRQWAAAGFVAVNVEYHGYTDGLYGDVTYPGPGRWGSIADATTELDVKPAMEYFLSHDPGRYGADGHLGVVVFGSSSGAHDAYMVGATGLAGQRISAVIGWSGLPDVEAAGAYPESVFDEYMRSAPGSDVEAFADPFHRIGPSSPPQYVANSLHEFISPQNAEDYVSRCLQLGIAACWLRVPASSAHAQGYAGYEFTGQAPELTSPPAVVGTTVLADSIAFARRYVSPS